VIWVYSAGAQPDLEACASVIATRVAKTGARVLWFSKAVQTIYLERVLDKAYGGDYRSHPEYGKSFAYFGYVAGATATAFWSLSRDIPGILKDDWAGTPYDELEITQGIEDITDIDVWIISTSGSASIVYAKAVLLGMGVTSDECLLLGVMEFNQIEASAELWVSKAVDGFLAGSREASAYAELAGLEESEGAKMAKGYLNPIMMFGIVSITGVLLSNIWILYKKYGRKEET
jgi:hypothetical protein